MAKEIVIDIENATKTRGGIRVGSGRPISTSTKLSGLIKARMLEKLYAKIDPVIDAQIEAAAGRIKLTNLTTDASGRESISISEQAPSTPAAKLLFENTIGKPKDTIEHKGGMGIVHLIKTLEAGNPTDSDG